MLLCEIPTGISSDYFWDTASKKQSTYVWFLGKWNGGILKRQLLAGASVFYWTIWLSRNDVVFDKTSIKSFLYVLYRGTYWLHFWSRMKRNDQYKEMIHLACRKLETVAM
jgi:hypothetical protein